MTSLLGLRACSRQRTFPYGSRSHLDLGRFLVRLRDASMNVHKASWIHREHLLLGQRHFANTSKLRTAGTANKCPRTVYDASDWLVWTPRDADVTSLRRELDRPCARQHAIFDPSCRFDCWMSGVNVKYIYQRLGGRQLVVGSHQSKIHKSTAPKWQDALYQ